jgi:hypothetical protein
VAARVEADAGLAERRQPPVPLSQLSAARLTHPASLESI